MTVSITAEIQAAGPDILWVIEEAGQDVTIRRPGLPDAPARAVLYQEDARRESRVSAPEFRVIGWQGVFKPDAPLHLPFTVVDAQGRELSPDGPPQDPGGQGVALLVHLLPLAERTRVSSLVFTLPGAGTVKDPKTGNLVPAPGTSLPVSARLVASDDPRVRDMAGADAAEVVLLGRWGTLEDPLGRPDGVRWGATSPLVLDGQAGVLTVKLAYPDADLYQERQFGARFVCVWHAS